MSRADQVPLAEVAELEDPRLSTFRILLIIGAILLGVLPFATTFNEFLTSLVENSGLSRYLTEWIVPTEARFLAVILGLIGIPSQVSSSTIYLEQGGLFLPVYISWNCVGWQSFILYGLTLTTGIQGRFSRGSKIETMVVGFLGTVLMNFFRIASVAVVAYHYGQAPAVIYHDYGGTIIILLWLFAYWWFSHGWLLKPLEDLPAQRDQEQFLQDIYHADRQSKSFWARLAIWSSRSKGQD